MMKKLLTFFSFALFTVLLAFSASAEETEISAGTTGETGLFSVYFGAVVDQNDSPVSAGTVTAYVYSDESGKLEVRGNVDFTDGSYSNLAVSGGPNDSGKEVILRVTVDGKDYTVQTSDSVTWTPTEEGQEGQMVSISIQLEEEPPPTIDVPTANPEPGSYEDSVKVILSGPADASVYYTTQDTDQFIKETWTQYVQEVELNTTTTIKAVSVVGESHSEIASFEYTINTDPPPPPPPPPSEIKITLQSTSLTLDIGKKQKIDFTTDPEGVNVTFASGNTAVATVEADGNVLAVGKGNTNITIQATKEGYTSATATVSLIVNVIPPIVTVNPEEMYLDVGETSQILAYADQYGSVFSYRTNSSSIATVSSSGVVIGVSAGTTTIYVTASNHGLNGVARVTVEVSKKALSLSLSPSSITFNVGETKQLTASSNPSGASVAYTSSNPRIASVNSAGVVTAVGEGKAVITGSSTKYNYNSAKDTVSVTVNPKPVVAIKTPTQPTPVPTTSSAIKFTDLTEGYWATDVIEALSQKGVIGGYPDNTFKPVNNISRAEFIKILTEAIMLPEEKSGTPIYIDVLTGDWYYGCIQAAVGAGLVKGYEEGEFLPNDPITRQEMAVLLARALGRGSAAAASAGDSTAFADDEDISFWARGFVVVAVQQDLISGYPDNTFGPGNYATRAEACAMIYRLMEKRG